MRKLGPLLSFQGEVTGGSAWLLSVLIVEDGPAPVLKVTGGAKAVGNPEELWRVGEKTAWRYRLQGDLHSKASVITYSFGDAEFPVSLPAKGHPPRIAYASCNGFSSLKAMKGIDEKNALWKHMASKHDEQPFNLLMMGGDQVYADSMWEQLPAMREWAALSFKEGNAEPAAPGMISELERFYFDLYTSRWSQPEVSQMLATVPSVMMWDDHDLIDGWGSYPKERQQCDVFQKAIWPAAERAFRTFQQHLNGSETAQAAIAKDHGFTFGHVIGRVAILALDMRSERSFDRVLTPEHWTAIYQWLEQLREVDHLLVMSSIPVVYPGFDLLERILGWWPGQNELEDDLRDHWNSRPHKAERLRLVHRLLRLAEEEEIRPTLISGDVHVAAIGHVESNRGGAGGGAVINQLISSGIVHPGPPGAVVFALGRLFDNSDEIDRGVVARMVDFPGLQVRFIGKRNYMTIEPDDQVENFRLWINWWVEGEEHPYTKVVHPLERRQNESPVVPQQPQPTA